MIMHMATKETIIPFASPLLSDVDILFLDVGFEA